jgi:hypothetical protein
MINQKKEMGRTSGITTVETLNRSRLDALGALMQAAHQLKDAENTLNTAQRLFLTRRSTFEKADSALQACLKRLANTKTSKITHKGGHHG